MRGCSEVVVVVWELSVRKGPTGVLRSRDEGGTPELCHQDSAWEDIVPLQASWGSVAPFWGAVGRREQRKGQVFWVRWVVMENEVSLASECPLSSW